MPITTERHAAHSLIRLVGECGINSASELKAALLDGLAYGKELRVDLELASETDITALQLLWAAERDLGRAGLRMVSSVPETVAAVAHAAGFKRFPGAPYPE